MILCKTPFRISFAGGGSDLPEFYRRQSGAVVSTTIDKSMYVAIHPYFHDKIRIKYSRTEDVSRIDDIEHPLVRECLRMVDLGCGMEIASIADVPAGTGLGSSSAFTVALLHALHALAGRDISPQQLADAACHVELERAGEPIGKQDQYAAAYGGLNLIRFHPDESVEVQPLQCTPATRAQLASRLMLFYIGQERAASAILAEQSRNMADSETFRLVVRMAELAEELASALNRNRLDSFGAILDEGWRLKSRLARDISNRGIESNYQQAREAGAEGGKILGAGGGGFLLLYAQPAKQEQVREAMGHLREMPVALNTEGSRILCNDGQNEPILARRDMSSARM
jgi:D-glycero-alpha-D-manno-heptose-7-phosphate kinase